MVISGLGGQGVLFVTRLLAEAAIARGLPVFTSETHGMAQRGGTVVSHLKIGAFSSPLIRPGLADGLLALKSETLALYEAFLKPGGWAAVNSPLAAGSRSDVNGFHFDADAAARRLKTPKAVNLIMLGFALSPVVLGKTDGRPGLPFGFEDVTAVLKARFGRNSDLLDASLGALQFGFGAG
jgi:indolepyruvate ferredoxin oxidoreductase beta subunit